MSSSLFSTSKGEIGRASGQVVVCAPDSFKGSLSAPEAAAAMARGIELNLGPERVAVRSVPLADGGEGTVAALVEAAGGEYVDADVQGPLGASVRARWGLIEGGATAVIEMAAAAGLPLVPPEERNPLRATTFGVGQLIAAALDRSTAKRILIGVGGSATCDGGIGMAQALGARFTFKGGDKDREPLTGGDLERLGGIDLSGMDLRLRDREIEVLCDVTNPLLGSEGAAAVYSPQKGASPADVASLESGLSNLANLWRQAGVGEVGDLPGAGAAGGLAAGLVAFCGARLTPGIDRILDAAGFDRAADGADLVLTGEGTFNRQSLAGKVVSGVARRCRAAGLPAVVLAGSVSEDLEAESVAALGVAGVFSLVRGPMTEKEAMSRAAELLARQAGWIVRLFLSGVAHGRLSSPALSEGDQVR